MIHLGDNSTVPAIGTGTIHLFLPSRKILIEALFVPRLRTSLMSVSELLKTYQVTFKNSLCLLEDCKLGSHFDRIYRFEPTSSKPVMVNTKTLPAQANSAVVPSINLWHQRLGHLSHQTLSKLLPPTAYSGGLAPTSLLCDICIKSKHQRKVDRMPAPRATRPFELLHSDLCGPISSESASGLRYFILYIDDFSHLT